MRRIKVILAEDHPQVRSGIKGLLSRAAEVEVVGEAGDGIQALELMRKLQADVLVLDIEMPRMTGIQLLERMQLEKLPAKILIVSSYDGLEYARSLIRMGVSGYLIKDDAPEQIVDAVRRIAGGETGWVSNRIAASLKDHPYLNHHDGQSI